MELGSITLINSELLLLGSSPSSSVGLLTLLDSVPYLSTTASRPPLCSHARNTYPITRLRRSSHPINHHSTSPNSSTPLETLSPIRQGNFTKGHLSASVPDCAVEPSNFRPSICSSRGAASTQCRSKLHSTPCRRQPPICLRDRRPASRSTLPQTGSTTVSSLAWLGPCCTRVRVYSRSERVPPD
jgi:hypothetical protein